MAYLHFHAIREDPFPSIGTYTYKGWPMTTMLGINKMSHCLYHEIRSIPSLFYYLHNECSIGSILQTKWFKIEAPDQGPINTDITGREAC